MARKKKEDNKELIEKNVSADEKVATDGQAVSAKDGQETPEKLSASEDEKDTSAKLSSAESKGGILEQALSSNSEENASEQKASPNSEENASEKKASPKNEQEASSDDITESAENILSSEEMSEILDKEAVLEDTDIKETEGMYYQIKTTCDVLSVRTEPNKDAPVVLYIKESVGNKKSYTIIEERDGYGYIDDFGWIALAYTVRI